MTYKDNWDEDSPWWGWAFDRWVATYAEPLWMFMHGYLCPACARERKAARERRERLKK